MANPAGLIKYMQRCWRSELNRITRRCVGWLAPFIHALSRSRQKGARGGEVSVMVTGVAEGTHLSPSTRPAGSALRRCWLPGLGFFPALHTSHRQQDNRGSAGAPVGQRIVGGLGC